MVLINDESLGQVFRFSSDWSVKLVFVAWRLGGSSQLASTLYAHLKFETHAYCLAESQRYYGSTQVAVEEFMPTALSRNKETAFQKARLVSICNELVPGCQVRFATSRFVNFYIRDTALGFNLTDASGDWVPSELADKSDEELRDLIRRFSYGKIA
jgi:hypothetical protein